MRSRKDGPRLAKRVRAAFFQVPPRGAATNVTRLSEHAPAFGVIERSDKLLVRFRDQAAPGGVQDIDLSSWLDRRPLAQAIADYIAVWGPSARPGTRLAFAKKLRPFKDYLDQRDAESLSHVASIGDLTAEVVNTYERWLNEQASGEGSEAGKPWSGITKASRYNALKDVVEHCRKSKTFGPQVGRDVEFKRNPWPGKHHEITSRQAISHLDLARIRRACIEELPTIFERLRLGTEARQLASESIPARGTQSVVPYKDLRIRLKALHERYEGSIPSRDKLIVSDPGLARSLVAPYGSAMDTGSYLHFTARSLVPIILLIAIDGLFNPEGLLTLEWSDVERHHPIFGDARWRIGAQKNRAGYKHFRSFAAGLAAVESPVNLLLKVEEFSQFTRDHVPVRLKNRVFVFWQSRGERFTSFDQAGGASADTPWKLNLELFIRDHKLPHFNLASLRVTGGDLVDALRGGDIKAKQAAFGHATSSTTHRHYETTTAKQRGEEALAVSMAWRERFIASNGKADSRDGRLAEGNQTAATPGFGCFEPLFSPIPGQRDGRSCSAYGSCPACPLAWVNVNEPKTHIRLTQLRSSIEEARTSMHPDRWLALWSPQLVALDEVWLPRFAPATVTAAATMTLPPLPALE